MMRKLHRASEVARQLKTLPQLQATVMVILLRLDKVINRLKGRLSFFRVKSMER